MAASDLTRTTRAPSLRTRQFMKSYKYKHKHKHKHRTKLKTSPVEANISNCVSSCDSQTNLKIDNYSNQQHSIDRSSKPPRPAQLFERSARKLKLLAHKRPSSNVATVCIFYCALAALAALLASWPGQVVQAFCPSKCICNDQELFANCTQVQAISIIPMTLNPLLKRLTLNHVPLSELSNSLALYRQLQQLNLNSNQLRQIKYENFNFKSAPKVITIGARNATQRGLAKQSSAQQQQQQQQSASIALQQAVENELFARQLKQSIDKQLSSASSSSSNSNGDDDIRFHLRELYLADNRIELLGDFEQLGGRGSLDSVHENSEQDELRLSGESPVAVEARLLRSHELERLAPFLGLSQLMILDLSGNKLSRLHEHVFLGLLKLKQLDLSRNQLEHIDKHALVGLIELEHLNLSQNKLVRPAGHAHQLRRLSQALCLGPLMQLRQLDLSSNAARANYSPAAHQRQQLQQELILPNQMFSCTPKLTKLKLRSLRLDYIQVSALDELHQLNSLDLSENNLEQVPLTHHRHSHRRRRHRERRHLQHQEENATSASLASLAELNLSRNPIEFVNANSFSHLKRLERLEMNSMPGLVSFDLASLVTSRVPQRTADGAVTRSLWLNEHLRELHLSQNHRLQSFHSSLSTSGQRSSPNLDTRIRFSQLKVINLAGSSQLGEVQLDKMIDLTAIQGGGDYFGAQSAPELQVDISNSNNLNCSSCQMSWLIGAFRQRRPSVMRSGGGGSGGDRSVLSSPPQASSATSGLGWSPIAFDPYNSFGSYAPAAKTSTAITLLNSDLINCAWPFSMPLIELINLETNYAPLFDESCTQEQLPASGLSLGPSSLSATPSEQPSTVPQVDRGQFPQQRLYSSHLQQQLQANSNGQGATKFALANKQLDEIKPPDAPSSYPTIVSTIVPLAGMIVLASLLAVLITAARHLVLARRKLNHLDFLNCSPSFTATTTIDSPSSSGCDSSVSYSVRGGGSHRFVVANPISSQVDGGRTQTRSCRLASTLNEQPSGFSGSAGFRTQALTRPSVAAESNYYYYAPAQAVSASGQSKSEVAKLAADSDRASRPRAPPPAPKFQPALGSVSKESHEAEAPMSTGLNAEPPKSPLAAQLSTVFSKTTRPAVNTAANNAANHYLGQQSQQAQHYTTEPRGDGCGGGEKIKARGTLFLRLVDRLSRRHEDHDHNSSSSRHCANRGGKTIGPHHSIGTSLRYKGGRTSEYNPNGVYANSEAGCLAGQPHLAPSGAHQIGAPRLDRQAASIYGNHVADANSVGQIQVDANYYSICGQADGENGMTENGTIYGI